MCFQFCSTGIPATGFRKLDPVLSRWSSPLLWIPSHPHLYLSLLFHHTVINYHTLIPKQGHDTPQSFRNISWHSFLLRITLLSNILCSKWNIFLLWLNYLSNFLWYLRAMCHSTSFSFGSLPSQKMIAWIKLYLWSPIFLMTAVAPPAGNLKCHSLRNCALHNLLNNILNAWKLSRPKGYSDRQAPI